MAHPSKAGRGAAEDPQSGHGSRVAGAVVSTVPGKIGGAPGSSLLVVKAFAGDGSGYLSDALAALAWIHDERPNVGIVNMSFGFGLYPGHCDDENNSTEAFADAIAVLYSGGTLSVAGAGNNGSGTGMIAPACIEGE
jgi:subtilisin family serine protease